MFETIQTAANDLMEEMLEDAKQITPPQRYTCGIDARAIGSTMWYGDDEIVVPKSDRGALDYYGGFEYIDKEYVLVVGDYVIYSGEHDRVRRVLDQLNNVEYAEEE